MSAIRLQLLIVEDDPVDQRLLEHALSRVPQPVEVHMVDDAPSALEWLDSTAGRTGRMLLTDLKLPSMDGEALLRVVRERPDGRVMPVVVFSTSASPRDIRNVYEAGANAYHIKPDSFPQLVELLSTLLEYWGRFVEHADR